MEKSFTTATLTPGTTLFDLIVGAGGSAGTSNYSRPGGAGGGGRISVACTTVAAPLANDRSIYFNNAGAMANDTSFVYSSSGNVGIGTTSPGYKLDVQGGDINASGSVRAATVALTSDIRYKRDIERLDNALEKILNIRGVSYNWRTEEFPQKYFNDRHQIGVIAQEVEQQFPEVVDTNKDGYKSVNYPALVAPLIEAVKTLYNRLIGVEATQTSQERRISSVEASKADKAAVDAKVQRLEAEMKVQLIAKDHELQKLKQENAAKAKEMSELKARLDKIEKALNSK